MVVLEPEGLRFVRATAEDRKAIWREHLLRLRLFHDIHEILRRQPKHEIERGFVLETIILNMPQEDYEKMFQTFIRWARFGDLFAYDEKTGTVALQ
jgi:NitT/TauT family transport system ATP-binding protein